MNILLGIQQIHQYFSPSRLRHGVAPVQNIKCPRIAIVGVHSSACLSLTHGGVLGDTLFSLTHTQTRNRHIETEQARLAESGAVSCDALNALSARYQKVASAVRAFERAQAQRRKDEAAAAAAAAAVAAAAVTASATADTVTTPARRDEPRTGAGGGVRQRSKRPTTGSDARAELLGTDGRDGDGEASEAGHSKLQEALAADMLQMTKTLKDIMKETGPCVNPSPCTRPSPPPTVRTHTLVPLQCSLL